MTSFRDNNFFFLGKKNNVKRKQERNGMNFGSIFGNKKILYTQMMCNRF